MTFALLVGIGISIGLYYSSSDLVQQGVQNQFDADSWIACNDLKDEVRCAWPTSQEGSRRSEKKEFLRYSERRAAAAV